MLSKKQKLAYVEQYCATHDINLTEKRRQVLSCLLEEQSALSAYDIISKLQEKYNVRMQPISVYRILDFLYKVNLIHRLELVSKYIACSNIVCDHEGQFSQFLICSKCSSVAEVSIDRSAIESFKKLAEKSGYFFSDNQLEFKCICKSCIKTN
ncbi:MAG: Fur family transcriptional regulator [Candidatus Lariskella arthropodorum]